MPGIKIYKSNNVASRSMVGEKTVQYTDGAGDEQDASDMRDALGLGLTNDVGFKDITATGRIITPISRYTANGFIDDGSIHVVDSATPLHLSILDSVTDGESISIVNKGTALLTLNGNISAVTAVKTLITGESVKLTWDASAVEWI